MLYLYVCLFGIYFSASIQTLLENEGMNISIHDGYYIITLNSTVSVQNQEMPERVILSDTVEAGMWQSCAVTTG